MRASRKLSRRSFVGSVVGSAILGGSATALVTGAAGAQMPYSGVTDCDTGSGSDRPGYGRGVRNQITDNDTGPNSDPRCRGRGSNSGSTGTQYNPREQPNTGCSDNDYGQWGDPGGHGRRCRGMEPNPYAPHYSGCTDNDPPSTGDSAGNGRRCTPR